MNKRIALVGISIMLALVSIIISGGGIYNSSECMALSSYIDIRNGTPKDTGNIYADPLFADLSARDFHLKSQWGRYTPTGWVIDSVTSPAIGAGEYGIEMGAYGGTAEASMAGNASYINVTAYFHPNGGAIYSAPLAGKEKAEINAIPSFDRASVVTALFNTTLPQGNVLVNFTANAADGNSILFRIGLC